MKKLLLTMGLAGAMTAGFAMTGFAGEWRLDSVGYWWQNDDGSYPASSWQWLDGNRDGVAECYYFGQDGYMAANTEIDGYQVNGDGAWVVDGVVQTKNEPQAVDMAEENRKAKEAYKQILVSESNEESSTYFCLLDINQDGIDELLVTVPWMTMRTNIYTYHNGRVELLEDSVGNNGYEYSKETKRLLFNCANHGVVSWDVYFHDGTKWVGDHASYYDDHWGDITETLLSYNDFYRMMEKERPYVLSNIRNKEEEYQNYKESWERTNAFMKAYVEGVNYEYDGYDCIEAENTPENREAFLR